MAPLARPAASVRNGLSAHVHRLGKAAGAAVEALERRQLLSAVQAIDYSLWRHLDPAFRRDLLAEEHAHPAFAMLLEADLRLHGLPALDAAAAALLPASLSGGAIAAASRRFTAMLRHQASRHLVRDHKTRMHKTNAHAFVAHPTAAHHAATRVHHAATHAHHPAAHHPAVHHPKPHRPRPARPRFGFAVSPSGPMVNSATYTYQTLPQSLAFTFSVPVNGVSLSSITIRNTSTGATLAPLSVTPNGLTYTFALTNSTTPQTGIPDGNYTATLNSQVIKDGNQTPLIGSDGISGDPYNFNFYFLTADVNHDGTDNQTDLNTIVANYGKPGTTWTYAQGDANFDGGVGFDDLLLLDREYETTLHIAVPPAPTASPVTSTSVQLTWPAVNDPNVTGYNVNRSDGTVVATNTPATAALDSGLTPSTSYTYNLASADAAGEHSLYAPPLTVTTSPASSVPSGYNLAPPPAPINIGRALDGSGQPVITTQTTHTARQDFTGWVGFQFTTQAEPLLVGQLGRYVYSGNSHMHTVKLFDPSTGQDVPGGSVNVNTFGATANQYAYAPLPAAITLQANHIYYLVSYETLGGGDSWYNDDTTVTPTTDIQVNHAEYMDPRNGTYLGDQTTNHSYGPVNFKYNVPFDSKLTISWTAPPPATWSPGAGTPVSYEIDRGNVQVGEVDASNGTSNPDGSITYTYQDTGLDAGQSYNYSVFAFDNTYDRSPAATLSAAAGPDQTPPNPPVNLTVTSFSPTSVTLTWLPGSDNVGVDHYNVYRNQFGNNQLVGQVPASGSLTFTDAIDLNTNLTYSYTVSAVDAAGLEAGAGVTLGTPWGQVPPPTDYSSDQYIPQYFQSYFYDTLVRAVRQLDAAPYPAAWGISTPPTPLFSPSPMSHWLDASGGVFADTVIANQQEVNLSADANGYYAPNFGSSTPDPNWELPVDPTLIEGQSGSNLRFYDIGGTGRWSANGYVPGSTATPDPIWWDNNGDNVFDAGDTVVFDPGHVLQPGDWGKTKDLNYYNVKGDPNHRLVWIDNSTSEGLPGFQQQFDALYSDIDNLALYYPNPRNSIGGHAAGTDNVASLLGRLSTTPAPDQGQGTISVADGTSSGVTFVTFTGTPSQITQFQVGDSIQIGNTWYPVSIWAWPQSPSASVTATLSLGQQYTGPALTNQPFRLRNWTLVPALSQAQSGSTYYPSFLYTRGEPAASNSSGLPAPVIFQQQFQELHDVIAQLQSDAGVPQLQGLQAGQVLPLTSLMDYSNVIPDTNLDGIVQVPTDMEAFGHDTGLIAFQPDRSMPQTYLPIDTDRTDVLPVHAYISQGGFGSSTTDVGSLRSTGGEYWTATSADENGQPFAYSLDSGLQDNLIISAGTNHIKRLEVVRPQGNSVVFDFPWNSAAQQFSSIGVPLSGYTGRGDDRRTYTLRQMPDGYYRLEFASGIYHEFPDGGNRNVLWIGETLGQGFQLLPSLRRYNAVQQWNSGRLSGIQYQSNLDNTSNIQTSIAFQTGTSDVQSLQKDGTVGGQDQGVIPDFGYSVSGSTITGGGMTVTRDQPFQPRTSCSVTLTTTESGVPGYSKEQFSFNSDGLLTLDLRTLSEDGSSATTTTMSNTYQYNSGQRLNGNGLAPWAQVSQLTGSATDPMGHATYQSWEAFGYDPTTGWMTEDVTPFKSSQWTSGSEAQQRVRAFNYDATISGNGVVADPLELVQLPREVGNKVLGAETTTIFNRFDPMYYAQDEEVVTSRRALPDQPATWMVAGLQSSLTIDEQNYAGEYQIDSPEGGLFVFRSGFSGNANYDLEYAQTQFSQWVGRSLSETLTYTGPSGNLAQVDTYKIGAPFQQDGAAPGSTIDAFGRVKQASITGGLTTSAAFSYTGDYWWGPMTVTETDGSTTKYTYTPLGQVATKIIYSGQSNSVMYKYMYDAAGNLVQQTTTAVDANGNPIGSLPVVTNTYAYDAMGRLTKEVDDANGIDATSKRTTSNAYTFDGTYNTTTTTYPDGTTTKIEKDYLDGTPASISGTGVTPSTYDEGVIAADTTDARGNVETAGSTWTETLTDGGSNYTKTFTNVLGQQYLVQQSGPSTSAASGVPAGSYADQVTTFDGNDRPQQTTGFDGSQSLTIYDPATGQPGAVVTDIDKDGSYIAGVDRKSIVHPQLNGSTSTSLPQSATDKAGADSQGLNSSGNTDDNAVSWNGGLNSSETVDGQTTTDATSLPTGGGNYSHTTTNPDGTEIVDIYAAGLLTNEKKLGTDGSTVIWTKTWNYDGLRRLSSYVDYTGTTNYTYFEDGTLKTVQLPGHSVAQAVNNIDANTEQSTNTTRPDSSHVLQDINPLGLQSDQSGAGTIPSRSTYDTSGTGQITSLETYAGAALGALGAAGSGATTSWGYDQATGATYQKQYADVSTTSPADQVQYQYNLAGQLANVSEPGISGSKFGYNAAGEQVSSSLTDSVTGVVASTITNLDELGREQISADQDNGRTFTTLTSYTPLEQLYGEQYASAGGAGTQHVYFPATGFGSAGAPGALQTLTVTPALGSSSPTVQQTYTYDSTSKRLNQITVNGINFGISYLGNSDQVNTVTATPTGQTNPNVTTLFNPDTTDEARLGEVKVTSGASTVYDENIGANYYGNDQRHTETVSRINPGGGPAETHSTTYSYNSQDELASVTDYIGGGNYSYTFDNAGNRSGTALGTATNINEYPALQYNGRGDLTNDNTNSYGWDAKDQLISVTPDQPGSGSIQEKMGYDAQGRLLWQDDYAYIACVWVLSNSKHYVWDVSNIVAELDQNNNLLESYTWGPKGLLAVTTYPTDPSNPNPGTTHTYEGVEDASGSVVELVDPLLTTGNVVASYHYDPFGNVLSSSGVAANVNPFLFQQMLVDANGKYYDNARWYDPVTGRFMSRDPAGETSSAPNPFPAFGNDPINNADPTGLYTDEEWNSAKQQVAQRFYSGSGPLDVRLDPFDAEALQKAYDTDPLFKNRVDDAVARAHVGFWATTFPAYSMQLGNSQISYGYLTWHDQVVMPAALKLAASEETLLAAVPTAGQGVGLIAAADSVGDYLLGSAMTAWGLDNTQAALTLRQPYVAQGISSATGSDIVGSAANNLIGVGLMSLGAVVDPLSGSASPAATGGLSPDEVLGLPQGSILEGLAPGATRSLGTVMDNGLLAGVGPSAAWINDPVFSDVPVVQEVAAENAAAADMRAEDLAELDEHDRSFYNTPSNSSLESITLAQGYSLRSRTTGAVLKYGETTLGEARYSKAYLKEIDAQMFLEAEGSKAEMHAWQHQQIIQYKAANGGARPPLNKTDY